MYRYLVLLFVCSPLFSFANGISVSGVSYNEVNNQLSFTLEWDNSWTYFIPEPDLYDAAWVFVKYAPNGGDNWIHAKMLDSIPKSNYVQFISYDDLGLMVYKTATGVGTFGPQEFTIELEEPLGSYQDFKVFATEMVFIDNKDFNIGDGVSSGRFYANGLLNSSWLITSESGVMRGNNSGEFNQEGSTSTTDLSPDFPKGWTSSFCMKYKITAQQYVDFLNCLTRAQQDNRVKADLSGNVASNKYVLTDTPTPMNRNPIACETAIGTGCITFFVDLDSSNPPNSINDGANIVLNHLTPADILAYLDWSGLRPMTELEYEKICRGAEVPSVAEEYAWGNDTYNDSGTLINSGMNNEATSNVGILNSLFSLSPLRAGYSATSTSNRIQSSATCWGVMDIHNLGEFMYGVESINFKWTSYGDGNLNADGNADVADWTTNAQLLMSEDPNAPSIEAISAIKHSITPQTRSAYLGARGVRRLVSL